MGSDRRVFVVGGHITPFIGKHHPDFIWKRHPDFGRRENPTLEQTITAAVRGALDDTGVPAASIEKAWIGNFVGELFSNQGHLGAAVVGAHEDLLYKPVMRVEGACASGGLAFSSAVDAIRAGHDIVMAVGAEVQTTDSARVGADYLARASHYARQREIDPFTFPAMFAARARAYREAHGLTEAELAHVSVKAYANANRNPLAHMKNVRMTHEQAASASDRNPAFLSNENLQPYLKVSDCSQVSDGGAAMIIVSEEGLAKLGKRQEEAIELLGISHATGNLYEDRDPLVMDTTAHAVSHVYAEAGIGASDIGVAEVHDCFTITELLMYEAAGWCDKGRAIDMVTSGDTAIDGRIPVNTGGGLVAFGHPVGATGIKQILEVYRQMKGACGDYQVPNVPEIGMTINMGGNDKTVVAAAFVNR